MKSRWASFRAPGTGGWAWLALAATLAGCTAFDTPDTYNRHRLSDITLPRDPAAASDIFYFDVTITAEFPDGSPDAEAERMRWLDEWLAQRNMCAAGREVVGKRRFDAMEDNPARRDMRYEVRCLSSGTGHASQ
ncbi:MAG: hypothetical protein IT486_06010 [Gammaproteobacteria bacterium]|nr:hypothetical protein [Gammaproteobacteria bacterium]